MTAETKGAAPALPQPAAVPPPVTRWQAILAPPVLALQFLTAVPVPLAMPVEPRLLGAALACFPLVGALLGLLLAALDGGLRAVLPVSVATAVVVAAAILLTGGLHLDGLMDACDGVFGGRTVERRLEIMRDSRVGSYGVLAGVLTLLLVYTSLAALAVPWRAAALVLTLTAGRWVMAGCIWAFPYGRPQGLGAAFKAGVSWPHVGVATACAAAVGWLSLGPAGLVLLAAAGGLAWLAARFFVQRLGGLTGDCYGAIDVLVEMVLLLGFAAGTAPHGWLIWLG